LWRYFHVSSPPPPPLDQAVVLPSPIRSSSLTRSSLSSPLVRPRFYPVWPVSISQTYSLRALYSSPWWWRQKYLWNVGKVLPDYSHLNCG
jgi:hypothetical protein